MQRSPKYETSRLGASKIVGRDSCDPSRVGALNTLTGGVARGLAQPPANGLSSLRDEKPRYPFSFCGGGSLMMAQNMPRLRMAWTNWLKSTGLTTKALTPRS
jgi:hypothetical protein